MSNECPKCGSEYTHLNRRLGLWECEDCGHRFEEGVAAAGLTVADLDRSTTRPLKVFLSYPHSSREICVMIRDALRARGHDVWFDEEHIHEGDDRRASIESGIDSHRIFVSCLTRDAVRKGEGASGVCLDELSIAISTPGCAVLPVLLEPADVVRPTAAVAHRQWLDMSVWREVRAQGEDKFHAWFSERMLRLFEVVETNGARAFAGEVEEVRKLLPLARLGTGREDLLRRPFEGRAWLARKLESLWIDNPRGPAICALWGDHGVGKSAFSVRYAMASDRVAAAVCLSHGDVRYGTMSALAQTLAYQLACRLPDYRAELLRVLRGTPVSQVGPSEVADLLFIKPLTYCHVDGGHENVCVLIDGLDECAECERDVALALLQRLRDRVPRWLRFLVVAYWESDFVSALNPEWGIWLDWGSGENIAELAAYLGEKLKGTVPDASERAGLSLELAVHSPSVFLFAEAVAESAQLGGIDPTSLPSTHDEALHSWLASAFPDGAEYERRFCPQISAMLASPIPLPEAELVRLVGADESDVRDLRLRAGTLLERGEDDFGEPTLSVAHCYVAEWLASDRAGRFQAYPREALKSMALACYWIATGDPDSLTGYEAAGAVVLCEMAGLGDQARELRRCREFVGCLIDRGDWLYTWGRITLAGEFHDQELTNHKELAAELDTPEASRDLSVSLERDGDLTRGDRGAADVARARSIEFHESFAARIGRLDSMWKQAESFEKAGDLAWEHGDLEAADAAYSRSLVFREELAAEPDTSQDRCDLSVLLGKVGDVAREREDLEAADAAYRRSLEIAEALVAERGAPVAKSALAGSVERVGDLARDRGDLDAAFAAYDRSLEIYEELVAELDTPQAKGDLAALLEKVGNLARDRGDLDAAFAAFARMLTIG